MPDAHMDDAG
jgi:U4/U6 small nuclear ribonucleoprotein PRP3